MGEKSITTQIKIDGEIVPDFSHDWEIEFQGEKYIMPLRIPQGAKENTSLNSTIDLTFQHWAIYQLKRWPFVTIQQIAAGTYLADEEVAPVQLNLKDFCILFGQVLEYYYGGAITIDFNDDPVTGWQYKQEATRIEISHTKIWNVLIDAFHDKYGVRWEIKPTAENSNTVKGGERYVIRVGYPTTEVDHIFEYGFEGGLLKVERQVQSEEIRNMLKGRGGETNIPFRYFKAKDDNNPDFKPDPDWVEELANIYFPNLMPATFRSYVQGWKAAHISSYPGYTAVGESNAYAPWAYRKGYTDTKFAPVEFVADEITINPTTQDKQVEILPGYSPYVKKGSSLDKYGPLPDTLDNNEDIYPTLQDTGLDIAVAVEQIESDDVEEAAESDAQPQTLPGEISDFAPCAKTERIQIEIKSRNFKVDSGKHANLDEGPKNISLTKDGKKVTWWYNDKWGPHVETFQIPVENDDDKVLIENASLVVVDAGTGEVRSASGIPAGIYYFRLRMTLYNTSSGALNVSVECPTPKLIEATIDEQQWRNTFDIWVKDIWDSAKLPTETDAQYSERVWKPVLGDRTGESAKVMFTSGALAHEDYEFTIVDYPQPDTSKTWQEENDSGVVVATHTSHWRIKLAKSDAELEATGLYVPSTQKQGKAGDTFVFIGTEMTHVPYVVDAEERLDNWKKDQLGEVKEIKPTAVVTTDRVRLNNEGKPNALINQLRVGNSLRLFDKRFFNEEGKAYETLYLQSITYTYREPSSDDAALNPDVEIVLGNEYTTSANPVSMMQSEINALQRQVGSISNIEQIVRAVGDRLYLRKDGISDRSLSPTQFFSLLTSGDFRAGLVGGAGWGFFKDENGNWVLETDRLSIRQDMSVNALVINQAEGRGGMEVDTAAFMSVTRVDDTVDGYVCYFDQKEGTVGNLFHVDDVAFCNQWTAENADLKFYKRRVTAVGVNTITLSKTDVNGDGVPAEGDNIIHYGNYTDEARQYVKVRDVVGGGYERYIEALNSVNAAGVEYYFIGRQAGQSRWFVGNKDLVPYSGQGDGSYIEYVNRKFNLHNVSLSIDSTIGDKTLGDIIEGYDASEYLRKALPQDTNITGGVILSTLLSLGYKDEAGLRHTLAGMNGGWIEELGGRTIGSWWGGGMVDLFDKYDNRLTPARANAATSLVRMDGSAYFANGNIGFCADGSGWLGNDTKGFRFSSDGTVTFGNGIQIDLNGEAKGLADSIESLLLIVNGFNNVIYPVDALGNKLPWNTAKADIHAIRSEKTFYSSEGLSALGLSGNIPGGGGDEGTDYERLDAWADYSADKSGWVLSAYLGNDLNTRVSANATSIGSILTRLTSIEGGALLTISTQGSGNAVTKIEKGGNSLIVTKGATFLTSHQTLSHIISHDTRSTSTTPANCGALLRADLKLNDDNSLRDGGSYNTQLTLRGGGSGSNFTYGDPHQIGFSASGNLWHRTGSGASSWGAWHKILDSDNYHTVLDGEYATSTDLEEFLSRDGGEMFNTDLVTNMNADLLDGVHLGGVFTNLSIAGSTLSVTIGGVSRTATITSATRLQTSRTLWGQSFNGSANVTGSLSNVGSIKPSSSNSWAVGASGMFFSQMWARVFCNDYADHLYLINRNGDYNINLTIGTTNVLTVSSELNVGIGTTTPASKLQVVGEARVSSLRIGDATITWDATNGGLKLDKGLYSTSYLSALGLGEMTDKKVTIDAGYAYDAIHILYGGINRSGFWGGDWNTSSGALNVGIEPGGASQQTPLLVAYRSGTTSWFQNGDANRIFAMELQDSGGEMRFQMGGTTVLTLAQTGITATNINVTTLKVGTATIVWDASTGVLKVNGRTIMTTA